MSWLFGRKKERKQEKRTNPNANVNVVPRKSNKGFVCYVRVKYDYVPQQYDSNDNLGQYIKLYKDDMIGVKEKNVEGWWFGKKVKGKVDGVAEGYFPRNYVEECESPNLGIPPPKPNRALPPRKKKEGMNAKLEVMTTTVVLFDYEAQTDSEISMKQGEEIKIYVTNEDGWYFGENAKREMGYFPSNFTKAWEKDGGKSDFEHICKGNKEIVDNPKLLKIAKENRLREKDLNLDQKRKERKNIVLERRKREQEIQKRMDLKQKKVEEVKTMKMRLQQKKLELERKMRRELQNKKQSSTITILSRAGGLIERRKMELEKKKMEEERLKMKEEEKKVSEIQQKRELQMINERKKEELEYQKLLKEKEDEIQRLKEKEKSKLKKKETLKEFLERINLGMIYKNFVDDQIVLDDLEYMEEKDLEEYVPKVFRRKRLMVEIQKKFNGEDGVSDDNVLVC